MEEEGNFKEQVLEETEKFRDERDGRAQRYKEKSGGNNKNKNDFRQNHNENDFHKNHNENDFQKNNN